MTQITFNDILVFLYLFALPLIGILLIQIIKSLFIKNISTREIIKNVFSEKFSTFILIISLITIVLNIIYMDWKNISITILIFYFFIVLLVTFAKYVNRLYIKSKISKTFIIYEECEYINRILNIHIKNFKYEETYNNRDYFKKLSNYPDYIIKFFLEYINSESINNNSILMAIAFLLIGSIMGNPLSDNLAEFKSDSILVNTIIPILSIAVISASLYTSIYFTMMMMHSDESENAKKINLLKIYLNSIDKK